MDLKKEMESLILSASECWKSEVTQFFSTKLFYAVMTLSFFNYFCDSFFPLFFTQTDFKSKCMIIFSAFHHPFSLFVSLQLTSCPNHSMEIGLTKVSDGHFPPHFSQSLIGSIWQRWTCALLWHMSLGCLETSLPFCLTSLSFSIFCASAFVLCLYVLFGRGPMLIQCSSYSFIYTSQKNLKSMQCSSPPLQYIHDVDQNVNSSFFIFSPHAKCYRHSGLFMFSEHG